MSEVDLEVEASEQLRRVQAVSEAALAHLSVDRLLDELLERVRELLSADTAAVLFLEESGGHLVHTAGKGLEEDASTPVRIPFGKGFAGRVAASGRPVTIEKVDRTNVVNPILLQRGVASVLGVPLMVHGNVIGVLHVGTLTPRVFRPDDVQLLQMVADRVALEIQVRVQKSQAATAETLQRALLPEELPKLEGFGLAARYVPVGAGIVGGDWYDVFTTPLGSICFAIGDVVGRGLGAAVVMGRLRNGVRAYALEELAPHEVMKRLNLLLEHFDPDKVATMVYGVIDYEGRVRFANAGHLPPLLVRADTGPEYLEGESDPLLGASSSSSYSVRAAQLEPGSTLVLFTDGLVEDRGPPIDEGLDVVAQAAARAAKKPVRLLCDEMIAAGRSHSRFDDDVAVLCMRFEGSPEPPAD
ncbi:MAG: SpoIIE family protein phosphatase [Actinomycetota bacterium]|nr:SpoIIE family protein phosphatase [Actinomycetota bacterium]